MQLYQLQAKQYVKTDMATAWSFLSSPKNLQKITPAEMGFQILAGAERDMFPGQIIHYTVSPFKGFTTKWVTEITHVEKGSYFVDEQRYGPYALWHHKHFIKEVRGGVEMEDVIDYKIPLGILGQIAHPLLVKPQLQKIFAHREKALAALFGNLDVPTTLSIKKI